MSSPSNKPHAHEAKTAHQKRSALNPHTPVFVPVGGHGRAPSGHSSPTMSHGTPSSSPPSHSFGSPSLNSLAPGNPYGFHVTPAPSPMITGIHGSPMFGSPSGSPFLLGHGDPHGVPHLVPLSLPAAHAGSGSPSAAAGSSNMWKQIGSPSIGPAAGPQLPELDATIIKQVEFYFSNSNLWKDDFLRHEIENHDGGWVSIPLITSFNRIKKLTNKPDVVAEALVHSRKLELNEDGSRVRRVTPLPPRNAKEELRRTIFLDKLPEDSCIESVRALCEEFGQVNMVTFLNPEKTQSYVEYDHCHMAKKAINYIRGHKELGVFVCFKSKHLSHAQQNRHAARRNMRDINNWRRSSHDEAAGDNSAQLARWEAEKKKEADNRQRQADRDKALYEASDEQLSHRPRRIIVVRKNAGKRIRTAKGPDGTPGFGAGRGRPIQT
jgi:La domain